MTDTLTRDDLIAQIEKLPLHLQQRLLELAKNMVSEGVEGKSLLRFEGAIPSDDLKLMSKIIEESCEKVDISEW